MTRISNILLLIGSIVIALLLVETALRLLPASLTHINRNIVYVKDEKIAYKFKPLSETAVVSSCFNTKVSANSIGFRGDEWNKLGGIAVLGDSFMEAIQVNDHETFSKLISEKLDTPVYNTGLSSFGTVAELLTYRSYLRELRPKIVLLSFFENDILDNHCATSQVGEGLVSKPCATLASSTIAINTNYYSTYGNVVLRSLVKKYCYTCNYLRELRARMKSPDTMVNNTKSKEEGDLEKEAWQITEIALLELKKEVEQDGGRFVIMIIPDQKYFEATSTEPESSQRLLAFARQNKIETIDLYPPMLAYARKENLSFPHFSYTCDGHWSSLGHAAASNIVSSYLLK